MKKGISLILLFILSLSLPLAFGLTASISNPRMVLYKNISDGETLEFQNSVTVNNKNPDEVSIKIMPKEIWEDKVLISKAEFTMQPGEREEVFYTVTIEKIGHYQGDIVVLFTDSSDKMLAVAQDLEVFVTDESGKLSEDSDNNDVVNGLTLGLILGIVLLITLVLLAKKLKMRK
tara:strand:+ start:1967 stop:2491 length:525 start_codon:yes stop_codon:yes gene_type:complete